LDLAAQDGVEETRDGVDPAAKKKKNRNKRWTDGKDQHTENNRRHGAKNG
jgi:hypothetical protein